MEVGGDLGFIQRLNFVRGVVWKHTPTDPGSDLLHVALALDAGEFGEHVTTGLPGVGSDDPVVLVDPDHCGDVADGVGLAHLVLGVNEDRIGDAVGEGDHGGDIFVQRHGNDGEVLCYQLIMQCLPPGQVECTTSPGGEGDQKASGARPFREPSLRTLEIQKSYVGSLSI